MESTSSGFDEAVGLYRESKIMHAVSVLNDLDESLLPNDPIVDSIKLRAQSMLDLRNACASDDGWILQKESHSVRTLYKNQPETPNIHSVRLDGDVDSPVFFVLALLHEVDLFTKWIPSYSLLGLSFANCVHHPSPTELFVHMQVAIPWPFTNRYSFFKCDGIDCMDDEVPQIGVILSNLSCEEEFNLSDDATKTDFHPPSGVLLTPIPCTGKTRVQICVNLDPKIHIVPSWLIDFAVRNLAFLILLAIRRAVVIVEEDPEYMKRMTDPTNEFYNFLRRRIHESLPTESQFVPSVRMRENSSEFEDAIDSSQDPDIQIC